MQVKFDCGCVIDTDTLHPYRINLDCTSVYAMLSRGDTKGVFQLESPLGKTYAKKLRPTEVEDLFALVALLRPAVLEAYDENGVNMVQKYCNRKNGEEETIFLHPILEPILGDNFAVIVYQELAMSICQAVAGFTESEADILRKAMGKKLPEEMAKVKKLFMERVLALKIIPQDVAEILFEQIQASQRYSFNRCVSGKTILARGAGNKFGSVLNVEEMYHIRNNIEYAKKTGHLDLYKKWKLMQNYGKSISIHDTVLKYNTVENIQPAGIKKLFRVTLANGSYIDCTSNHKFPTPKGEKKLEKIKIGDSLYIKGDRVKINHKYGFSKFTNESREEAKKDVSYAGHIGFGTAEKNYAYTNGEYTKWEENRKKLPNKCLHCGATEVRLEIHHKDRDRCNNDLSNLERLCVSCHKKADYKLGRKKRGENGYVLETSEIVSIEDIGEEMTYDVTMAAPYHTFTTDQGIVTCNSHSAAYGEYSYITAYFKWHFPDIFFCSYLTYASEKIDPLQEKSELVNEAKKFDIAVCPPDFRFMSSNFHIKDGNIYFGMSNIKGVGESKIKKLLEVCKDKQIEGLDFYGLLLEILDYVDTTTVECLIKVGAFDYLDVPRAKLLFQYSNIWSKLVDKEKDWLRSSPYDNLKDGLSALSAPKAEGGGCSNKNRVAIVKDLLKILKDAPFTLCDTPAKIARDEESLLGISLTYHEVDSCDTSRVTCSCKEYLTGYTGDIVLGIKLTRVNEIKTKRGKEPGKLMAFLSGEDSSGVCDNIVCFPQEYELYKQVLSIGNTVQLFGSRSKDNSLIVKQVDQI